MIGYSGLEDIIHLQVAIHGQSEMGDSVDCSASGDTLDSSSAPSAGADCPDQVLV